MIKIPCNNCGTEFEPDESQAAFVDRAKKQGMTFMMLDCPRCGRATAYNPTSEEVSETKREAVTREAPLRCPVSRCIGWVSFVEASEPAEKSFWGCGECGSIWYDQQKMFAEISAIVQEYPYRRKCYAKRGRTWGPAKPNNTVKNYDDRVLAEPDGTGDSFVRG